MQRVNIIIPAYNEALRLPATLMALASYLKDAPQFSFAAEAKSPYLLSLVIVCDGSTDGTFEVASRLLTELNLQGIVLNLPNNKGKGYAVRFGVLNSETADYYFMADADLSSGWQLLPDFLTLAEAQEKDCVIGSRATVGAKVHTKWYKKLLGRISALSIQVLLGLPFQDTQCGYKLFAASCLPYFKLLQIDRWGFDFEILYLLHKAGLRIQEVPVEWNFQTGSNVKLSDYLTTFSQLLALRLRKDKIV